MLQAEEFLTRHGLKFSAVLVGSDCPSFCEDAAKGKAVNEINTFPRKSHIHGKHYYCTTTRAVGGASVTFDFWNSYAGEERNFFAQPSQKVPSYRMGYLSAPDAAIRRKYEKEKGVKLPTAYDLLTCITKNDPGTFADFCSEFGYDEDSRKAFDVYLAVQNEWAKVSRFFTAEELAEAQEIQ